jgi:hypothetical protein
MSIDEDTGGASSPTGPTGRDDLRSRAIARLRARSEFRRHLLIYVAINAFVVLIWWWTGVGFFWPIFPIFFWGIGIVAHAWQTYGSDEFSEERIRREINRLSR